MKEQNVPTRYIIFILSHKWHCLSGNNVFIKCIIFRLCIKEDLIQDRRKERILIEFSLIHFFSKEAVSTRSRSGYGEDFVLFLLPQTTVGRSAGQTQNEASPRAQVALETLEKKS